MNGCKFPSRLVRVFFLSYVNMCTGYSVLASVVEKRRNLDRLFTEQVILFATVDFSNGIYLLGTYAN